MSPDTVPDQQMAVGTACQRSSGGSLPSEGSTAPSNSEPQRGSYPEDHNPTAGPIISVEARSDAPPLPEGSPVPDDIPSADSPVANSRLISDNGLDSSGSSIVFANVFTTSVGDLEELPSPSTSDTTIAIGRPGTDLRRGSLDLYPRSDTVFSHPVQLSDSTFYSSTGPPRLSPLGQPSLDNLFERVGVTLRPDPPEERLNYVTSSSTTMFSLPRGFSEFTPDLSTGPQRLYPFRQPSNYRTLGLLEVTLRSDPPEERLNFFTSGSTTMFNPPRRFSDITPDSSTGPPSLSPLRQLASDQMLELFGVTLRYVSRLFRLK